MFPAFEAPPNVETIGMRRARKANEQYRSRRNSASTAHSSKSGNKSSASSIVQPTSPSESGRKSFFRRRRKESIGTIPDTPLPRSESVPEADSTNSKVSSAPELPKSTIASRRISKTSVSSSATKSPALESVPTANRDSADVKNSIPAPLSLDRAPAVISSPTIPEEESTSQVSASRDDSPPTRKLLSIFPPPPITPIRQSHISTPPPTHALPTPPTPRSLHLSARPSRDSIRSKASSRVPDWKTKTPWPPHPQPARPASPASTVASEFSSNTVFTHSVHGSEIASSTSDLSLKTGSIHRGDKSILQHTHVPAIRSAADQDDGVITNLESDDLAAIFSQQDVVSDPGDHTQSSASTARNAFARTLCKMECAGPRVTAARLTEEWYDYGDEEGYQEQLFEKRLWAMTAYQWLMQGKQLQSPTHEQLINSKPESGRRLLHIAGSQADGWILAARYPNVTVYTVSSCSSSFTPSSYNSPLNHHNIFVPSYTSQLPFPDGHFDAIISRALPRVVNKYQWIKLFLDCTRVLKSGGKMEIHSVDPHMARQGDMLRGWVDNSLLSRLESEGKLNLPSNATINAMAMAGLRNVRRAKIALSTHSEGRANEQSSLLTQLGRHVYEDSYGELLRDNIGESWFWKIEELNQECEAMRSQIILTVSCAQKP